MPTADCLHLRLRRFVIVRRTFDGAGRFVGRVFSGFARRLRRVANRIGLSNGTTPLAVEEDLLRVIPVQYALHAHHWLILHGRYVCVARNPKCGECVIRDLCEFRDKTA